MHLKHIITAGCSFADKDTPDAWPRVLEKIIKSKYPNVEFNHTGMGSQGNELIQKKSYLALINALEKYDPSEIAVLPMWSGTERKTFYVDNREFINDIKENWKNGSVWWGKQFADLNSNILDLGIALNRKTKINTTYNRDSGWYICNYLNPDSSFVREYFNLSTTVIGPATISLENIIMLQNACKVNGVKIFQSFYRNYVYDDIIENKDHLNLNYLHKQLDYDTIISTTGIYEHLRPITTEHQQFDMGGIFKKIFKIGRYTEDSNKYFLEDNWHPNELGSTKWINEILIPTLTTKGFFNE